MRGGARENAGRKAAGEGKRVAFTCMINPMTRERIDRLKSLGYTMGVQVDRMVEELYNKNIQV